MNKLNNKNMETDNIFSKVLWCSNQNEGLRNKKVLFIDNHKLTGPCNYDNMENNINSFLENYIDDKPDDNKPSHLKILSEFMKDFFNLESSKLFWDKICYANINEHYYSGDKITMINKIIEETSPDIIIILGIDIRNNLIDNDKLSFKQLSNIKINDNKTEWDNEKICYIYKYKDSIILNTYSPSYNDYKNYDRLALFTSICFDDNIYYKILKNEPIKIKAEKIEDNKPFKVTLLSE